MATIDELKKVRLEKLEKLRKAGVDPYPATVKREQTIAQILSMKGKQVAVCGRVMGLRGHGKIVFADVVDGSGKIQVVFKQDILDTSSFNLLVLLDIGDFIETEGKVDTTQAGQISIFATRAQIITKAIRPLPSEWHGLKDVEERYRQRYVDLLVNPGVREIFVTRAKVVQFLRNFLDRDGFLEVETPVLQPIYGGASAKPFVTHHNALDADLYLRISDELYLKRLIVAGFEKVYEMSKDFRNEGIDHQHNPEFTMLEFYWAYADYDMLMTYTEKMLADLVKEVTGSMKVIYDGQEIDFTPPWPRKTYRDVVLEFSGVDINIANDEKKLMAVIKEKKIALDLSGVVGFGALLDTLYKATARPHLTGPMFLTDRPTAFVALAKRIPDDPTKTASFQLLIAGKEVLNAYNELNDPQDQEARWRESEELGAKGQSEHENVDADYIRALEYGMPPTAGWGMGIDRLVSILTNQVSLKEVILFPTLRPEKDGETKKIEKYDYKEKKIIAILSNELNKGKASNALGHMAVSAGRYLNEQWMGQPIIHDADGVTHKGISKYPFIVLSASSSQIKELITSAKQRGIFCVDYPQEMFDTGNDGDLVKQLSKAKNKTLLYHAVLLAGKTDELNDLTSGLSLYK